MAVHLSTISDTLPTPHYQTHAHIPHNKRLERLELHRLDRQQCVLTRALLAEEMLHLKQGVRPSYLPLHAAMYSSLLHVHNKL